MSDSSLNALPAVGYLSDMPLEHRTFLAGYGKYIRTTDGQRLIVEGSDQNTLYLVLSGTLHATTNDSGRAVLLGRLAVGDSIGEINLFDPIAASANVTSIGECLIWSLTRDELESLFVADPATGISVMKGLLKQVSSRIRHMNEKLLTNQQEVFFDFWTQPKS